MLAYIDIFAKIIDGTYVKNELLNGYELNELFSQNYELLKSSFFFFKNLRIIYQIWQMQFIKTNTILIMCQFQL